MRMLTRSTTTSTSRRIGLDVVGYNLADRLQDQFGVDDKRITARAVQLYAEASDDDREEFVRFMPEFI